MRIVVCVKQVPGTSEASLDPETKRIVREGVKAVMNPFDAYALEEGVRLVERLGGEVVVLSMGPPRAVAVIKEAISAGASRGVLLSDRAFGGSDTWATSYALSMAVRKLGGVDLVICGKQAVDGDTAQVGPGIAAHLGWAQATYVMGLPEVAEGSLLARRMHEDGWDLCRLRLPAVLTVVKGLNQPRVPTLRGRLQAERQEIPTWTAADIGADPAKIGLGGSPTRVVKAEPPPPRGKETLRLGGSAAENAQALVRELRRKGLV